MEDFRQAMAFPLLLTILWLLWVLEKQSGMEGVLWLLGGFIGLGFCAWFWKRRAMPSRALAVGHGLMIVLIAAVVIHQQKRAEVPTTASSTNVLNCISFR